MNVARKSVCVALATVLLACGLGACGNGTPGEKLDRALDKTGDKVKEAGEAIKPQ